MRRPVRERIAAAPISWGVCEVPGWGWQYDAATVLDQMREVGLAATEFGPDGLPPDDPSARAKVLAEQRAACRWRVRPGGPARPGARPRARGQRALEAFVEAGRRHPGARRGDRARGVRRAAGAGRGGLGDAAGQPRPAGWRCGRAGRHRDPAPARRHDGRDAARRCSASSTTAAIGLCLDTGHLLIGGADPVALARDHADADRGTSTSRTSTPAGRPRAGRARSATPRPSGRGCTGRSAQGDVDIAAIVGTLEAAGYAGWYVLEQDTILRRRPAGAAEEPLADVRASIAHLRAAAAAAVLNGRASSRPRRL